MTPEPGLDLPTEPGVWVKDKYAIVVFKHASGDLRYWCWLDCGGWDSAPLGQLSRGGWLKATAATPAPADPLREKLPIARIRKVVEDIERMMRFTPPRRDLAESNEWYQAIRDAQDLLQDLPDESLLSAPQADQPTVEAAAKETIPLYQERIHKCDDGKYKPHAAMFCSRCMRTDGTTDYTISEVLRWLNNPQMFSPPAPEGELPRVGTGEWHEHPCDRDVPDGECSTSEMLRRCANLIEKCAVPADFNVPEWTAALRGRADVIEPKFRQHAAQPVSPAAHADAEIKAGQVKTYDSMDQLIDDLPAAPAEQGDVPSPSADEWAEMARNSKPPPELSAPAQEEGQSRKDDIELHRALCALHLEAPQRVVNEISEMVWSRIKQLREQLAAAVEQNNRYHNDVNTLCARRNDLEKEIEGLRLRLLSAAGDDLCRLTQEEIKKYTSGEVQIPPKEEFMPSCDRFWEQTAAKVGVLKGCLTLAQLIAENEKLTARIAELTRQLAESESRLRCFTEKITIQPAR